jgi:hypothetical protein
LPERFQRGLGVSPVARGPGFARSRAANNAAREAKQALLIRAVQYEREAADLLAPLLLREASPQWIAEQLVRLLPPEDREAAQVVGRVLKGCNHPLARAGLRD